jgi:phosphoenolpyruvate carboxykinase (ATP)
MFNLAECAHVHRNNDAAELYEHVLRRGGGRLSASGALSVMTGEHTGRSAADKYTVRDATTENTVWWDNSKPMRPASFDQLVKDLNRYAAGKEIFVQDLFAGAAPSSRLRVRVICEYAWHALFIRNLLVRPQPEDLGSFEPDLIVVDFPGFKAAPAKHETRSETVIACDFARRSVLIGGTSYAGEIKKSVFTFLSYSLPEQGIVPMHCSVNEGHSGDAAVFFGLSGTGKTTLSADPARRLIGDDEHGWSGSGVFNFEGGCYAKTIRLSEAAEPEIFRAVNRFGAILENVVIDPRTRLPNFDDASLAENSRGAYPIEFIPNAKVPGMTGHPTNIVMLTADAFGVLPPLARLTPCQAMYHFLSGYTARVAGTETGISEPKETFSTCFGAPFMPRHPSVYGNMLRDRIAHHGVTCWLVNTGWIGGQYGLGRRMPLAVTRQLLLAALSGELRTSAMRRDPNFGFDVPLAAGGVNTTLLNPRETWADRDAYDAQAAKLVALFNRNFARFLEHVDSDVKAAAPVAA